MKDWMIDLLFIAITSVSFAFVVGLLYKIYLLSPIFFIALLFLILSMASMVLIDALRERNQPIEEKD